MPQTHSRRDCLNLGLTGATFGLASMMRAQAATKTTNAPAKSCIFFWLDGGLSHHETFDPKPDAPREFAGEFGVIPTSIPGVRFGEMIPRTAKIAHEFTVLRNVAHHDPGHGGGTHYLLTGRATPTPVACGAAVSFHPSMGSAVAKERGWKDGIPPYIKLAPNVQRSSGPSFLGAKHAPFHVSDNPNRPGFKVSDVSLPAGISEGRIRTRNALRDQFDGLLRIRDQAAADPAVEIDDFFHQAVDLITSPKVREAFDISREPDSVREAYGRTFVGQGLLVARRLVEVGVPWIFVQHGGWDHHVGIFPKLKETYLPIIDQCFPALLTDLKQRGLLDETLVLMVSEFGRTPLINNNAGRDHWPGAGSIAVAGAGVPKGQVVGETDIKGAAPISHAYKPEDLSASIFTKLGIDPHTEYTAPDGRPIPLVRGGSPIPELS